MRAIGIAVIAVLFLAIVYAAFDMRRDHNQINQIREECQRTHGDAGEVKECMADLALRQARQPRLP
jgi:ABC-type siderophore export system fused ATPase/permease subunit